MSLSGAMTMRQLSPAGGAHYFGQFAKASIALPKTRVFRGRRHAHTLCFVGVTEKARRTALVGAGQDPLRDVVDTAAECRACRRPVRAVAGGLDRPCQKTRGCSDKKQSRK